jgi:type VI secretion system protein ImpL
MKRENRRKVYVFPLEILSVQDNLAHVIGKLFQPNPYQESPIFRGFYFTSGTQEGVPIDRVIQSIAKQFDLPSELIEQFDPEMETKSYFIKDLFTEVIIPDQHLVEQTSSAATRNRFVRLGAIVGSAVILVFFILSIIQAYIRSKSELGTVQSAASQMEEVRWETNASLATNFNILDRFRELILELEIHEASRPISRLGMYRGDRLLMPARMLYDKRIHVFVRRYLYDDLDKRLQAFVAGHSYPREQVFDYLKAYLLMGSEVARLDSIEQNFLNVEFNSILDNQLYQSLSNEEVKELQPLIERQLQFFIESLIKEGTPAFENTESLVTRVRNLIYEPLSIKHVYTRLKRGGNYLQPFTLAQALRGRYPGVFLSTEDVPGIFTRNGWDSFVKDAIEAESENPGKENWVFGIDQQSLPEDMRNPEVMVESLRRKYFSEYAEKWWYFLRSIEYEPFGSINIASERLRKLGDFVDSPLVLLLDTVAEQTRFESQVISSLEEGTEGVVGRIGKRLGIGGNEDAEQRQIPRHPVDQKFVALHELVNSSDSQDGLTGILEQYIYLHEKLETLMDEPGSAAKEYAGSVIEQKKGELPAALSKIHRSLSTFDPISRKGLFEQPVHWTWLVVLGEAQQHLNTLWRTEVYKHFQSNIANYYPFNPRNHKEVPFDEVEQFFQPGTGIFWVFINEELKQFIRRGSWQPYTWEQRGINLSTRTINALRHADSITDGLFSNNELYLEFSMQPDLPINNPSSTKVIEQICITIDGEEDCYWMGRRRLKSFTWPGDFGSSGARLEVFHSEGSFEPLSFYGEWALFRLLEKSTLRRESPTEFNLQWPFPYGDNWEILVKYKLRTGSARNPFGNFKDFFSFQCPRQLD